ncbi:autophagy-related protein 2 homolog A isoform X2 [Aricia agestis]|uniref:autophagy-related protein 2 homolog A isoform X2 n=1 Tax=Aricia agestis TaxID=91739 RepID=UPI001C204A2D|nr:autophagy-related protein 2 homolog A isoform X2 [Aricia agestis]
MTSQAAAMVESFTSSVSSMNTSMTSSVNTSLSPKIRRNKRGECARETQRQFPPMTSQAAAMVESFTSSVSSINTSMTSSVNTSLSPKIRRDKRGEYAREMQRQFPPMTSQAAAMVESFTSSVSSMNTSMTSSVNTSLSPKIRRNKRVSHIDGDPTAEVSHISLRIASVSCVLLHKDVLFPTPISGRFVTVASATRLQQLSTEFFSRIQTFTTLDDRRLSSINKSLDAATDRDHLRFLALEISLDGSEKVTAHGSQTVCEAAVRNALLRECLYNQADERHTSFDLVKFENKDDAENSLTSKANLKINFKQTSKYLCVSGERKLVHPTTDIVLKCMPFHVDIELSVLDRVCASVWPPPRAAPAPPPATPPAPSHNHLSFALHCPDLALLLRFPIVDLRPGVDRDARRVRPDYLEFKFQNATLSCAQTPSLRPLPTTVSLTSTILDLYYHENEHSTPTHIARSTMDESKFERNILKCNTATHLPTISLTFQKRESAKPFDSLHEDLSFEPAKAAHPMTTSMYIMNNLRSTLPSPFSGKKMAHQSINKNEANSQGQEEEIIVPGTDEEMAEFTTSAVDNSAIHLDFTLPILSLQLESKQMYEIIYNRINSDLLLWEPRGTDGLPDCPINPAFGACKSAAYDSDSDSSTSDEDNLYYSTYDGKAKKNAPPKVAQDTNENEMHNFCLTFKVGEGLLTIYAPVRDSNKRVVPGQTGELSLRAGGLRMCHVSGLRRRARTAQLGLRAADIALYHEPILTIPSEKPSLRLHGSVLPSYLKSTIYRSHSGVIIKDCATNKDIFTMALKTEPDPETPGLKTICIALGIEQATLRHRGGVAWLTQLMDVLDVVDYPVAGYTPSTVLSELHVHVWDCAVDYRPLYLPIRTILTLGNFSVSSNIIPDTSSSHLRFLAQECALFLGRAQEAPPNVHKDYVCVLDLGLFELSVRTDEKSNGSSPALSVTASNNMVNVYTCWDSASALCRLLTYAAADGDSAPPRARSNRTSVCSDSTAETLVGLEGRPIEEIRELSPNEIQQVNDLMAEAMKESPNSTLDEDELNSSMEKEGVEVFFFPDESNMKQKQLSSEAIDEDTKSMEFEENKMEDSLHRPTNTQVTKDLGDPTSTPKSTPKRGRKKVASGGDTSTDDEYCMVEAAGDGEMDEPVVTWLGSSLMLDNHFAVPPARADVLAAPKSFPPPVTRYTLCELSLTWHMYGGTDFTPASDAHAKKTVTIDTKRGSPTPSRNKESAAPYLRGVGWSAGGEAVWAAPAAAPRPLRTRGGPKRDHSTCVKLCLTKVKFQHETYGSGGAAASRQTLAVTRLEVLDRVQRSDINKLLSQYRRADEPDRKNAHMLVVKAVHLRADAALPAQECCLKVSLLPLRFILDQDTLAFLVGYFSKLGSDDNADDDNKSTTGEAGSSRQSTPTHRPPVMSIASHLRDPPPTPTSLGDHDALSLNETVLRDDEPLMETYEAERLVSENLIQLEEDFQRFGMNHEKPTTKQPDTEPLDDSPIYFRRVVFSPEVPIRLDYVGKRVDLSAGPVAGLLMGLGQLNCSELTLKRLDYKLGLLGVERLVQWALAEWVSDIKRHQLPGLLGGIGPMHSLLQILTGIRDLVWLPVEQWRRDGRVVRGLRRGAASFTARAALAALDLTARLLHLIQATAETAFDMLTPSPPLPLTARGRRARRRRADNRQPADIREGVASAYTTVKEGFAETAAQMRWAARRGHSGGVLRQLPGAALAPLALAAAGAADVLGGVRAHIAPQAAVDQQDKWRAPDVTDQS